MTGIVNSTGAKSGIIGTTVGTPVTDLATATFPAGHVIQVISDKYETVGGASDLTVSTTAEATPADGFGSNLSVDITPKQTNSKIHISFQGMNVHTHTYAGNMGVLLFIFCSVAGGTFTNVTGDAFLAGVFNNGSASGEWIEVVEHIWYLHTPSYTAGQEIRYRVFYAGHNYNSSTTYLSHSRFVGDTNHNLDAIGIGMEIAG